MGPPAVPAELRPRPVAPVLGRRVAYFTTAPGDAHAAIERYLGEELGAEVVLVSGNLAHRDVLREDLARACEAEVYLVEIKAAAIDVVAEAPPAPLPGSLRPRPTGDPARGRRHRHGQVHRRHRRRLSARHHARHLD